MVSQKERPRTKKVNKKNKHIKEFAIVVIAFTVIIFLSFVLRQDIKTEVTQKGTAEEKISAEGYLLRNETVIKAQQNGMLCGEAGEGERVKKGFKIATVYTGAVESEIIGKLKYINERINSLNGSLAHKELSAGDSTMRDASVSGRADEISALSFDNETKDIVQYKDDIKRLILQNDNGEIKEPSTLEQLQKEKYEIETGISSGKSDVYANVSGVFCSYTDGLEETLSAKNIENLKPSDIKKIEYDEENIDKEKNEVKIVDNYEWYFGALVEEKKIYDVKEGNNIYLRFPDISDELLEAKIYYRSESENGKVFLVASCNKYLQDIYSMRKAEGEFIFKSISGYRVPKDAVIIKEDGTTGVYVVLDETASFKEIEISYTGDDYVIVKANNNAENALRLYDEVIVEPGRKDYDGKVVRK